MSGIIKIKDSDEFAISICPNGTEGEVIELGGLLICLPKRPPKKKQNVRAKYGV